MKKNNKKIILYLGGGAMSGVYGAGVLKGLHDLLLTESIEAIYSGSAGSVNAAYLLSDKVEIGSTIYWEDLRHGFLFPFNIIRGTIDLFYNRFIKEIEKEKFHNVVNVDYVYNILQNIKPLDLDMIKNHPISLYVKVLDIDTGETEYKVFKDYANLALLKAAINVKPYSFEETILNGKRYVDATIKEPLGIEYLLDKYPDRKIVVILNEPIKRGFRHYLKNFLEGTVSGLYPYNISLYKMFMNRENLIRKDIQICLSDERILLLYPNLKNRARPRTTDPLVLQQTFNLGLEDAKKVIDFIH